MYSHVQCIVYATHSRLSLGFATSGPHSKAIRAGQHLLRWRLLKALTFSQSCASCSCVYITAVFLDMFFRLSMQAKRLVS